MFPIRDHNPSLRTPYVTFALIAANVVVFVAYWYSLGDERAMAWFFYNWGLVPERAMSGQNLPALLTSMFLHGGWLHLAGNMLFLWIFGDNLEDEMGHFRFLGFYLISGLCAAGLQIAAEPGSTVPMVGASGAIAGVMGGYLLLFPRARIDVLFIFVIFFRIFAIPAWIVLLVWFGLQLFSSVNMTSDGVAYWAHAGGFLGGLALALPLWLARGGRSYWNANRGLPPHPEASYKLSRSGIPSVRRR